MQQHYIPHIPHAPQPPPPGMPGLAHDFGRMHLDPSGHPFAHNMQQPAIQLIQPPGLGHMPDPRPVSSNDRSLVGYKGYTFTKHPAEHVGQKETWAIVDKELMPGSQADLKGQIEKHRKKGVTGLDQYNNPDMKGFKRKQVDELIRECTDMDPDHRFEYNIASIKRDTRRQPSGPETSAMKVILRRQPRPGVTVQGPFMAIGNIHLPTSGLVDLSGVDDYEKSSQNSSNGHRPGAFPFERHLSEPWVHVAHPDARPPVQHAHSLEHTHPHGFGSAHGHGHGNFGNREHAHGQEQPIHGQHGHPHPHEEAQNAKHDHEEKPKKHKDKKDKKDKSPKIVHAKEAESPKSHDFPDFSFSDSDSSSGDTDQTPNTSFSSEGSHYHHKDKKYHKSKHHRKSSSHDHEHEPVKVIYREHRRKEPPRRLSSPPPPPPTHRPRYRYEDVIVEPDITHHRRAGPSYPREHFDHLHHHRAMSYDDERLHDHDLRGSVRRPSVYRRRIMSTAHLMDPYEERRRHELDREAREEEAFRRRDRYHHREAVRGMMDADRILHGPHSRMDRMHGYHDDHLRGYHDDHY